MERSKAYAALLLVQLFFGLLPVSSKLAFQSFGTGGTAFLRLAGATALLWASSLWWGWPRVPRHEHPRLILASLLGVVANQLLFLYGLARTSSLHAVLIITTLPAFTLGVAALLGQERLTGRRVAGIAVGAVGVGVLLTGRDPTGSASWIGDAMVLANIFAYSLYLQISRQLLQRYPPRAVLSWVFLYGLPIATLFTGLPALSPGVSPTLAFGHPPSAWAHIAFIVLGPTIGAYALNLFALQRVPSSTVALFVYLQPFVTAALAVPLLGERLSARTLVAFGFTAVGVWLATRPGREDPAASEG